MKKSNLFRIPTILFASSIIISSCGSKSSAEAVAAVGSNPKATEFANSMCKMAEEIGLDENFKLTEDYLKNKQDKFKENTLNKADDIVKLLKQVDKHLGTLNNDQKTAFSKELMKAIIDTKCSNIFFKEIPFDKLGDAIVEMEKEITKEKYKRDHPEEVAPAYPTYEDYNNSYDTTYEAMPEEEYMKY